MIFHFFSNMDEAILKRALGGYSEDEEDDEEGYEPTAAEDEEEGEDEEAQEEDVTEETENEIHDRSELARLNVTEFDAAELKAIKDVETVLEPLELPAIPPLELPVVTAAASNPSLQLNAPPPLPDLPFADLPLPLPLPQLPAATVTQQREPPPQKVGPTRRLVKVRDLPKNIAPAETPLPFVPHQKPPKASPFSFVFLFLIGFSFVPLK